MIQDKNIL